jgi:antitoxin (DNA-binding transcriptional repressor) of toxin-antitoxin stability system
MARAAKGEEVVVTKRGRPYVRLLPAATPTSAGRYPLRGSVRRMAKDFDAPQPGMWTALRG